MGVAFSATAGIFSRASVSLRLGYGRTCRARYRVDPSVSVFGARIEPPTLQVRRVRLTHCEDVMLSREFWVGLLVTARVG